MSILDEGLPPFEDLIPEELQYLRKICKALKELEDASGLFRTEGKRGAQGGEAEELFDADELGLDPESDNERY